MKRCRSCSAMLPDGTSRCPSCGGSPDDRGAQYRLLSSNIGSEYRSRATLFGWPLIHVVQGSDPRTGRVKVARGIIAVGGVSLGVVAVGGVAAGGLVFGGVGMGLLAIGGMAVGFAAFGGMAVAAYLAVGGLALSLTYAIGGAAVAPHAISAAGADPELVEKILSWLEKVGLNKPSSPQLPEHP